MLGSCLGTRCREFRHNLRICRVRATWESEQSSGPNWNQVFQDPFHHGHSLESDSIRGFVHCLTSHSASQPSFRAQVSGDGNETPNFGVLDQKCETESQPHTTANHSAAGRWPAYPSTGHMLTSFYPVRHEQEGLRVNSPRKGRSEANDASPEDDAHLSF
ncbi:hypothetical protein VTK56DRAFT_4604 [Thermocarpiscus australiensis]